MAINTEVGFVPIDLGLRLARVAQPCKSRLDLVLNGSFLWNCASERPLSLAVVATSDDWRVGARLNV